MSDKSVTSGAVGIGVTHVQKQFLGKSAYLQVTLLVTSWLGTINPPLLRLASPFVAWLTHKAHAVGSKVYACLQWYWEPPTVAAQSKRTL